MSSIKSEWPLLVFTTCAPVCAGAWIVAAALTLFGASPQASALTTGPCGMALCALLIVSLACSTLHLGKPTKALRAFGRLGNSTVSNEVFMGSLFALSSVLYLLISPGLASASEIWKIPLALVAAFAALFVVFQCLAYRMRTVSTWNSVAFSVEFAVIALLGGVCLEGAIARLAVPLPFDVRLGLVAVGAACCAGMVFVVCAEGSVVARAALRRPDAEESLARWGACSVARVLALAVGFVAWGCGMLVNEPSVALACAGFAVVVVGIAIGRFAFYRFYLNVGLPRA